MVVDTFSELNTRYLTKWLTDNYPNKYTQDNYKTALKNWIKFLYGKDSVTHFRFGKNLLDREVVKRNIEKRIEEIEDGIERYLRELDHRDFTDDFKKFLKWARNEGYAPLNIRSMSTRIKIFFNEQDDRCKISDKDWRVIKRTLLPKSSRPATQDDILTKEQLKIVLSHLSIHAKAMILFLLSTGARKGAACQLKMSDINLDSDPPEVNIRGEYTKGEVGGRVMWFGEEARDAIIEWHKERLFKMKPGVAGSYDLNLVFNFKAPVINQIWNKALKRADGGRIPAVLARRDPSTKLRYYVYHVHTLRKFFRTNMGVKGSYEGKSGVPDMVVHAWMGHKPYLSTYDKLGLKVMSEIYKDNMNVVTVHDVGIDEKTRYKLKETMIKAEILAEQTIEDRVFVEMVGGQLDIPEYLSMEEKKNMIIYKVAQIKLNLVRAREQSMVEFEKALKHLGITEKTGKKG